VDDRERTPYVRCASETRSLRLDGSQTRLPSTLAVIVRRITLSEWRARPCASRSRPAALACVIAATLGRSVVVGTHVQREGWETFGGYCRMARRQLSTGRHL
jgi:hypothetical protein